VGDRVLYLFDGYNVFYAAGLGDRRELVDALASYVALCGARGVVVFDGVGEDVTVGALDVRFAAHADEVIEKLAAANRGRVEVVVVTSDRAVLRTAGQESRRISSKAFVRDLRATLEERIPESAARTRIGDALDEETRRQFEWWRRQRY
jgi:predicted RNA-binding protein with PIN domain